MWAAWFAFTTISFDYLSSTDELVVVVLLLTLKEYHGCKTHLLSTYFKRKKKIRETTPSSGWEAFRGLWKLEQHFIRFLKTAWYTINNKQVVSIIAEVCNISLSRRKVRSGLGGLVPAAWLLGPLEGERWEDHSPGGYEIDRNWCQESHPSLEQILNPRQG